MATFLGSKSPRGEPCIERSGCPAQLRVALEGPPHRKTLVRVQATCALGATTTAEVFRKWIQATSALGATTMAEVFRTE